MELAYNIVLPPHCYETMKNDSDYQWRWCCCVSLPRRQSREAYSNINSSPRTITPTYFYSL